MRMPGFLADASGYRDEEAGVYAGKELDGKREYIRPDNEVIRAAVPVRVCILIRCGSVCRWYPPKCYPVMCKKCWVVY
jgi:hypothetical protein